MFAGECWITKVVTVLVDCKKKAKKCCPGFIQDSSTSKFKCIAESGCGGASKLTQSSGSIHSANYPAKYEADLNCQWRIEAPPNHLIQLDFSKVDLEDSAECRFDKVQIADSNSERIICGRREPLTIMSSSNYLDVTFKSDDATEYTGFSANYTFVSEKRHGIERKKTHVFESRHTERFKFSKNLKIDVTLNIVTGLLTMRIKFGKRVRGG